MSKVFFTYSSFTKFALRIRISGVLPYKTDLRFLQYLTGLAAFFMKSVSVQSILCRNSLLTTESLRGEDQL